VSRRLRVFISGAYSAQNVIDVQANMRRGLRLCLDVLKAGHAPWGPWLDFTYGLLGSVTLEEYYDLSLAWLEAADAVLVQPVGESTSVGTKLEVARARALGIPVFWSLENLLESADILIDPVAGR